MLYLWKITYEITWVINGVITCRFPIYSFLFIIIDCLLAARVNRSLMPFLVKGLSSRNMFWYFRSRAKVKICTINSFNMEAMDVYVFSIICWMSHCVYFLSVSVMPDGSNIKSLRCSDGEALFLSIPSEVSSVRDSNGDYGRRVCCSRDWIFVEW